MKIGIDSRVLMDEHYSGVSEYTANLLIALLAQDKINEYKLFYNSFHDQSVKFKNYEQNKVEIIAQHFPNKIFNYVLEKTLKWPKLDKVLGGVDIFFSPHFNFSSFSKQTELKKLITVHDLSFLRHPEFFSKRKNFWHRALAIKNFLRQADLIIAVSENTKADIIDLMGIEAQKIKVIYSGNNLLKREISETEKKNFLIKYKLTGRLILYLGNIEPRKNITRLISAFNLLRSNQNNKFKDLKLVLAGASGWKNKKIYQAYKKSPFQNDIIFLGYISKKEREIAYRVSQIFVYPSLYEGFGFPPLEAMANGLPVLCSNVTSLPEVVADAALMINPFSEQEISHALELLLTDQNLRQQLIIKGYQQAAKFSWEKTANEYLKVFQQLYERSKNNEEKS